MPYFVIKERCTNLFSLSLLLMIVTRVIPAAYGQINANQSDSIEISTLRKGS
jgi:hypothetical protein